MNDDYLWRCACGTAHYLRLTWDEDSTGAFEGYFLVEGDFRTSVFRRVLQAWRILRNGHEDSWVEVILTPETAEDIAGKLLLYAKRQP